MISVLLATSQSIIVRSQSNIQLLLSIRPDQGVDLGHVSIVDLLYSPFDLVLVGFDICSEPKCVAVFCLLSSSWPTQCSGKLGNDMVKLVALPRIIGLPLECLGPLEGG